MRAIIEQSIEFKSLVYTAFIDFERSSDSVNNEAMLNIIKQFPITLKIINLMKICENFKFV